MVQLVLPLIDNNGDESQELQDLNCDETESIYDRRHCIKDSLFCSNSNLCPSNIDCINGVCQCLPDTHHFISLTPPPVRMLSLGCNFDTTREAESCRGYEYGVDKTCLLNYCSEDIPCYAGTCDPHRHVCVNINSTRLPLPSSRSQVISLGDDPFGFANQESVFTSPILVVLLGAGGVLALLLVIGIFRLIHRSFKTSITWMSRAQRLSSTDDLHFDDKDGYFQELDQKFPCNGVASETTIVNISTNTKSTPSFQDSKSSLSHSPAHPPSTYFHDEQTTNDGSFSIHRQELELSLCSIELVAKDSTHESLCPTAEMQDDPNRGSQSEVNGLTEPRTPAQHVDPAQVPLPHSPLFSAPSLVETTMARHQSVSHGHSAKNQESGLYKSRSVQVRGSKILSQIPPPVPYPSFTSVPLPLMEGSLGVPVPRQNLNTPQAAHARRNVKQLTLMMPPPPTYLPPGSTSTSTTPRPSPRSSGYPSATPLHSAGHFLSSGRSTPSQSSQSSSNGGWSRHHYVSYQTPGSQLSPFPVHSPSQISIFPAARKLPAGFASSPVAKTVERFA